MSNPEKYQPGLSAKEVETAAFPYKAYQFIGGRLNENFFDQSAEFLSNGQALGKKEEHYCLSCRHYTKLAGFFPRLDQEKLYAYLRAMMPSFNGKKKNREGKCPWQLGDQPLLAEVFLLTEDVTSYEQFTTFFSNIFERGEEKK